MGDGILQRLLQPKINVRASGNQSLLSLALGATQSGVYVTPTSALSASAVWACVRVLSESVAQLPFSLYRRDAAGKSKAVDHPVYRLLHDLPNPEMTSYQLRRLMMVHLTTWGTAFCEIEWSDAGYPLALWPLPPNTTEPVRANGELFFDTTAPDGKVLRLPAYRVWNVTGLGTDPLVGISPIKQHMQTIGLSQAMTAHGGAFFRNGARPGIVLRHPGTLNPDALARLKESVTLAHEGLDNAYRTMILEEGMDIETVGIPPEQQQFLQSREFQTVEIARIFNVPPHMIQHLADATYSNIEHQGLQFVTNSLMPYLVNIEQTAKRDLLVEGERDEYYAEFSVDGLQRGDIKTRYEAYSTGIQTGILSINEARGHENLDNIEGGDVHLVPLNLGPLDAIGKPVKPASVSERSATGCTCGDATHGASLHLRASGDPGEATEHLRTRRVSIARGMVPIFADVYGRIVRRETKAVAKLVSKHMGNRADGDLEAALDAYYNEFLPSFVRDMTPAMLAMAKLAAQSVVDELGGADLPVDDAMRAFVAEFLRVLGTDHANASKYRIGAAVEAEDGDPQAAVDAELAQWEETRATNSADLTAFEALNALVIFGYSERKIRRIMWLASGTSCKFCASLSGQTIDIESFFVGEGTEVATDGGAMKVGRNKRHGPLHGGCDCVTTAVIEAA
jgi:HK97 family phage portal protein